MAWRSSRPTLPDGDVALPRAAHAVAVAVAARSSTRLFYSRRILAPRPPRPSLSHVPPGGPAEGPACVSVFVSGS